MRRTLVLALLPALAALATWLAWPRGDEEAPPPATFIASPTAQPEPGPPAGGPTTPPALVRVLDPWGRPAARTAVVAHDEQGNVRQRRTDAAGHATFEDLPADGSWVVTAHAGGISAPAAPLVGPEVVLRLGPPRGEGVRPEPPPTRRIPARVVLVDRATGALLPSEGWTLRAWPDGTREGRASAGGQVEVVPGQMSFLTADGPAPVGYVHTGAWEGHDVGISVLAREIVVRVALQRSTALDLEVLDAEGRPVPDPRVLLWQLPYQGWDSVDGQPEVSAGRLHVELPHFRGLPMRLLVTSAERLLELKRVIWDASLEAIRGPRGVRFEWRARLPGAAIVEVDLPLDPSVALRATTRLPGPGDPEVEVVLGIHAFDGLGLPPPFGSWRRFAKDMLDGWGDSRSRWRDVEAFQSPPTDGRVYTIVRVLRRDGRPAPLARVRVGGEVWRAGADGCVGLGAGSRQVREIVLVEPGMVATTVEIPAEGGWPREVVLREGPGGDLRVHVVDEEGQGLPGAEISSEGLYAQWIDGEADVQIYDPYADAEGRRTLRGLSPGSISLSAGWEDLVGEAKVEVVEGARHRRRDRPPPSRAGPRGRPVGGPGPASPREHPTEDGAAIERRLGEWLHARRQKAPRAGRAGEMRGRSEGRRLYQGRDRSPVLRPVRARPRAVGGAGGPGPRRAGGRGPTGGVLFEGDRRLGCAANLWLRSAIRVQEEILAASIRGADDLYAAVASLAWDRWIHPDQTLAVFATLRDAPDLRHSGYAALKVKDAVVDVLRGRHGRRPSVDTKHPDVPIRLYVQGGRMWLYRDWSGTSLHKRGWRPIQVKSPLNEATAAGLLRLTGWDRRSPLVDPMCGSGTFPVEAALWATDRAPGLGRHFAFEQWIDHDAAIWAGILEEARARVRPSLDFAIEGADHHGGALDLARLGARTAGVDHLIRFTRSDAREFTPEGPPALVVANPPYGERLGTDADLVDSWTSLGNFLHRRCAGATAWVLCGNPDLTRHLGLRTSLRVPVMNGPIECRWLRYHLRPSA